jgi:hypothetical protein
VKTNIASAICFVAFVGSGLLAAASGRLSARWDRRRLINFFLFVALFVSFTSGLTQHDMWPFSSWKMMTGLTPPATRTLPTLNIVGADASGNEYDIDYRAWKPLSPEELDSWLRHDFYELDPTARDRVARYLLQISDDAREQALSSTGLAFTNRSLGPLTAPTHLLHPAIWSHVESVPHTPFVGLRIYEESWDLEARRFPAAMITRALAYEYPRR